MLRVIFDTNIYGHLLNEIDAVLLEEKIIADKEFVIYGYIVIRKELRDVPTGNKLSRKTRILLLGLYDRITEGKLFQDSIAIQHLAKKYYDSFRENGGIYGWDTSIRVDFMIVACASLQGLDIVYSADKKTLLSKIAKKAYQHINLKENLRTPNLLAYEDLLLKLRNYSNL